MKEVHVSFLREAMVAASAVVHTILVVAGLLLITGLVYVSRQEGNDFGEKLGLVLFSTRDCLEAVVATMGQDACHPTLEPGYVQPMPVEEE